MNRQKMVTHLADYVLILPASIHVNETYNLATTEPKRLSEPKDKLEEIIANGHSTPEPKRSNDSKVKRYPEAPCKWDRHA